MPEIGAIENSIFNIHTIDDFNAVALEIFHYQYKNNIVYKRFVDFLNVDIGSIKNYSQIPFLPIEFYKQHNVVSGSFVPITTFTSSGTTGVQTSKHLVKDLSLYERSFREAFDLFFGKITDYTVLALLPSYLEREGSSLVYMADNLITESRNPNSGFYLAEYEKLSNILQSLRETKQKVLLLGVTYALLDLAENYPIDFPELILMETGGMKGRRKELVRDELHNYLKSSFGVSNIYSEYGMTELLSQSYSQGGGIFNSPPWMKILIRDVNDPLTILSENRTGGINVIDLANIHSCSFIATQDLGKNHSNGSFEILGRFDNSDIRGCNLMIG